MKNRKRKFLRRLLLSIGGLFALVLVAALVVSFIAIPIDLTDYKGLVETTASHALGRAVTVDGEIMVTTSLWPVFEMQGLTIANPAGFESADLARMEQVRVRVGLLPLLARKVHVKEFRVAGLALDLVRAEGGAMNWAMGDAAESPPASDTQEDAGEDQPAGFATDAFAMDRLALQDISVSYTSGSSKPLEFVLEDCDGSAPYGKPMDVTMHGVLLGEPFELAVQANSLGEFLAMTRSRLEMQLEMAGTSFQFAGSASALAGERSFEMDVSVGGERLDSLDGLLHLDLPPLQDYYLGASVRVEPGRLELSDLEIRAGESTLTGKMAIDRTGPRPTSTVELTAETIQLDDFDMGEWSPEGGEEPAHEAEVVEAAEPAVEAEDEGRAAPAEIMSPEVLERGDVELTVQIQQVLSGDDDLGGGELKLALHEGRISLDPLRLAVPGGELLLQASLKPDTLATDASLRVLLKNFDFGIFVRRSNPDSDLGGVLNVDLDVQTSAGKVEDLLARANGYIDVSAKPENLEAGIIDLWAVNLYLEDPHLRQGEYRFPRGAVRSGGCTDGEAPGVLQSGHSSGGERRLR